MFIIEQSSKDTFEINFLFNKQLPWICTLLILYFVKDCLSSIWTEKTRQNLDISHDVNSFVGSSFNSLLNFVGYLMPNIFLVDE